MRIVIEAEEYTNETETFHYVHHIRVEVDSMNCGKETARKAADAAVAVLREVAK